MPYYLLMMVSYCLEHLLPNQNQAKRNSLSIDQLLYENHGLRNGVYMYKGCSTNEYLSARFKLKYTDLDLLITSNL